MRVLARASTAYSGEKSLTKLPRLVLPTAAAAGQREALQAASTQSQSSQAANGKPLQQRESHWHFPPPPCFARHIRKRDKSIIIICMSDKCLQFNINTNETC